MIKDLNNIYETAGNAAGEQLPPEDDKPKVNPGDAYLEKRKSFPQNMSRAGSSFKVEGVTKSDQQKFFGETGIYDPALTGQNIALEAGERQSFGSKLTRRLGNLVPNILANFVDIIGSTGSLLFEWGDERDYHNGLNELADRMKNPLGENYRRSTDTWAIGDPTWWIDNAFNTIEYAAPYAIAGIGAAKALGTVARGISTGANLGTTGTQWMNQAAMLGTSGLVSYAQGAQDGAYVFKQTYDVQFKKAIAAGQSPEEAAETAKHIAAESAATTAQLSTLLTMGVNTGAYAPLFRNNGVISRDIIASRLMGLEFTSFGDIARSLRGMNAANFADRLMHKNGLLRVLDEMAREGGEEVVQLFAQKTGSELGNQGKIKGFIEQLGEVENIVNKTGNSEGLFAFTLGATFGGLQNIIINNIPSRRVEKLSADGTPIQRMNTDGTEMVDKNGNPVYETHLVSPRTYEKDFSQRTFNTIRDAVAHDFENMETLRNEFLAAVRTGDEIKADEIREEMFNVGRLHAIRNGMTEPWIKSFERISELDPKQATDAGFAINENDESYKEKASEAITDLKHLDQVYKNLQKRYGVQDSSMPGLEPLVNMVFAREADLYSFKKRLDKYKRDLQKSERTEQEMLGLSDPQGFEVAQQQYITQHNSATEVNRQLNADIKELQRAAAANDIKAIDRLLKKYRAIGFGTDNRVEAIKDLASKLQKKNDEVLTRLQAAESAMLNSTGYSEWIQQNPGKSFNEYMQEVNKRTNLNIQNRYRRAELDKAQAQYDIARQNLADMTSEKNATRFAKKAEEWRKQIQKDTEEIEKQRLAKLAQMTKDKSTLSRLERIGLNQIASKYQQELLLVQGRISDNNRRIASAQKELASVIGDPLRARALKKIIQNLTKENEALSKREKVLESLYAQYHVDDSPTVDPVEPENVNGDQNGKDTINGNENASTVTSSASPAGTTEADIDAMVAEIEGASSVQQGVATIEDELNALREEIENASQVDIGVDPFGDYSNLYNSASKGVQIAMDRVVSRMLDGTAGFSLDHLNAFIDNGTITKVSAHKLLMAARDYVQEIERLMAIDPGPQQVAEQQFNLRTLPDLENMNSQPAYDALDAITDFGNPLEVGSYVSAILETVNAKHIPKDKWDQVLGAKSKLIGSTDYYTRDYLEKYIAVSMKDFTGYDANEIFGTTPPAPPAPVIIVADISAPDTPVLEPGIVNTVPENSAYHAGFKTVNAALTGATSTIGYEEGTKRNKEGELVYVKVTLPDKLADVPREIFKPDQLTAGHALRYEVDINYEGPKMITDSLSWDGEGNVKMDTETGASYLDTKGKVRTDAASIGNVPIRVLDANTGKFLFHIRKMDWINAKFPGTRDYRNVVESTETDPDNISTQSRLLLDLRTRIVERFNTTGLHTDGAIAATGKGTGRLILNHVVEAKNADDLSINSKVVPQLAYNNNKPELSMLPQESLELVIVGEGGTVQSGKGYAFNKPLGFDTKDLVKGGIGAMVQAVNGQYMYAPLIGMKLIEPNKPSPALSSVVRAIELFILNDGTNPAITAEINDLEKNTNFNVATAQGLRAFINQYYTYIQDFQDSALSPNAKTSTGKEQFVFSIDTSGTGVADKTKMVKIGFTSRGDGVRYANIRNGALSPEFVEVLTEGFQQRARAVVFTDQSIGIKGINSSGKFYDAVYVPGKGWKHNEYKNYNQYVKSFSKTPVYGRNQLSDGTYVYTANPQLPITMPNTQVTPTPVNPNTSVTQNLTPQQNNNLDADLFDQIGNFSLIRDIQPDPVSAIGEGTDNSTPLTLAALQEKYNFTPMDQRNGLTPLEIFEQLTSRGHTYLSDGYNPFTRCQ